MEERDYLIILYDFYSELLTDKQKEYFEDYYFSNLSLGEIAENTGLSRNAIHKNIKTVEEKLMFYEEKLELYKKRNILADIIKEIDNKDVVEQLQSLYWGPNMTSRKYKMYYDYNKRTRGGFTDVLLLSGLMIASATLIMLALNGGK